MVAESLLAGWLGLFTAQHLSTSKLTPVRHAISDYASPAAPLLSRALCSAAWLTLGAAGLQMARSFAVLDAAGGTTTFRTMSILFYTFAATRVLVTVFPTRLTSPLVGETTKKPLGPSKLIMKLHVLSSLVSFVAIATAGSLLPLLPGVKEDDLAWKTLTVLNYTNWLTFLSVSQFAARGYMGIGQRLSVLSQLTWISLVAVLLH